MYFYLIIFLIIFFLVLNREIFTNLVDFFQSDYSKEPAPSTTNDYNLSGYNLLTENQIDMNYKNYNEKTRIFTLNFSKFIPIHNKYLNKSDEKLYTNILYTDNEKQEIIKKLDFVNIHDTIASLTDEFSHYDKITNEVNKSFFIYNKNISQYRINDNLHYNMEQDTDPKFIILDEIEVDININEFNIKTLDQFNNLNYNEQKKERT